MFNVRGYKKGQTLYVPWSPFWRMLLKKKIHQNKLATQPKPDPFLMTILALCTSGIIHSISVIPS